jgi:hypothetical protein
MKKLARVRKRPKITLKTRRIERTAKWFGFSGCGSFEQKNGYYERQIRPQIPNGGLAGKLGKVFNGIQKMWDMLQVDRVLISLAGLAFCTCADAINNLGTTLFSVIDTWLDAFNFKLSKMNDEATRKM